MKGIRFEPRSVNKKDKTQPKKFVPPKNRSEFQMLDHMAQQPTSHMYSYKGKNMNYNRRCHNCGRYGNIRPYYFILYGDTHPYRRPRSKRKDKKAWRV